jgi:hypothetical protein
MLLTRTVTVPILGIVPGAVIETFTGIFNAIPGPIDGTFENFKAIFAKGANFSWFLSEPSIVPCTVPAIAGLPLTVAVTVAGIEAAYGLTEKVICLTLLFERIVINPAPGLRPVATTPDPVRFNSKINGSDEVNFETGESPGTPTALESPTPRRIASFFANENDAIAKHPTIGPKIL